LHFCLDCSGKIPKINRRDFGRPVLIIAICLLLAFFLRDYMSLRMSPSSRAARRSWIYGAAILLTAVLISTIAVRIGLPNFAKLIQSPRILFSLIAVHIAATVLSIWIRQTQNYNWIWATALLPTPIVWLLLLETTLLAVDGSNVLAAQLAFFTVALLWAASMIVVIWRARDRQMPIDDLDFVVLAGGWSHWLALCALPLATAVSAHG
jgi:hypothetical protein